MLIIGYILVGLAVSADVPTSWTLISEFVPVQDRGKIMILTDIIWYIGPFVVLVIALAVVPIGLPGIRILVLTYLCGDDHMVFPSQIVESKRRKSVKEEDALSEDIVNQTEGATGTIPDSESSAFVMDELCDLFSG